MARDFVESDANGPALRKELIHRHVAWLHMLATELRKITPWEHQGRLSMDQRRALGLANDVPIINMARGIEIDIRQMIDETDLPPAIGTVQDTEVVV